MLLLRVGKYKSSWEPENPLADLLEAEFSVDGVPDLQLSVYQVESSHVVRVSAEHNAAAGNRPPSARTNVDMTGSPATVVVDPVDAPFALIATSHRELRFGDADSLREFIAAMRAEITSRAYPVTGAQVKQYVRGCLKASDPEWTSFVQTSPAWKL